MKVRLTRKLAEMIDGIDLSRHAVGDVMDLDPREARLLMAEGWAEPVADARASRHRPQQRAEAAERPRPRSRRRKR